MSRTPCGVTDLCYVRGLHAHQTGVAGGSWRYAPNTKRISAPTPASGLFNQTVQSKRGSIEPSFRSTLYCWGSIEPSFRSTLYCFAAPFIVRNGALSSPRFAAPFIVRPYLSSWCIVRFACPTPHTNLASWLPSTAVWSRDTPSGSQG